MIGEIYFVNNKHDIATKYQKEAIKYNEHESDLYYMMLGNYLLAFNAQKQTTEGIKYLKKSIQINKKMPILGIYWQEHILKLMRFH